MCFGVFLMPCPELGRHFLKFLFWWEFVISILLSFGFLILFEILPVSHFSKVKSCILIYPVVSILG